MTPFENQMGMTVRELKAVIKDWPEEAENGEPTDVWMQTGRGLSSPVGTVRQLGASDLILGVTDNHPWEQ